MKVCYSQLPYSEYNEYFYHITPNVPMDFPM